MSRYDKVLEGAAIWASYYRENVTRFAKDYLHLSLYLFQKILLTMMFSNNIMVFIGSRGLGKTFLSAVFCVIRAILWPGSKIVIVSGNRGQSMQVFEKIQMELMPKSPELCAEIDERKTTWRGQDAKIVFKNTSFIKVVTASDSARGNRADVLILDEFRMIKKDIVNTVLRKFLTNRRMPDYKQLSKEDRKKAYRKERKLTMYLSSAYWSDSWCYDKCVDTLDNMIDNTKRQFLCGFPYHLPVMEGMLDPSDIIEEMHETDFSEVKFSMEYCALFYGAGDDSFFNFDSLSKNRHIAFPMLPDDKAEIVNHNANVRITPKQNGERRILSADIALMSSKKHHNDATAIFVNQMFPTKSGRFMNNIVYATSAEGLRTEDQALMIRRLFDEYECDYLVLDTQGIGLGVYDALAKDIADPITGEIYPALSCMNDKVMADRCLSADARKVIWSVKANAQFNSDCAFLLREGFRSGRVRLLQTDDDGEMNIRKTIKGFDSLDQEDQIKVLEPYIQTTLLIDEMVKLQYEETNGKVRLFEKPGMRKDRYSSLSYNYYVSLQIEHQLLKKGVKTSNDEDLPFLYRAPKIK